MFGRRDRKAEQPRDSDPEPPVRCSFCHKSRDIVRKLISSPPDYPRSYICDECVTVCQSILEDDDTVPRTPTHPAHPLETKPHPLINHPIASELLTAAENWIKQESLGFHANAEFAALQRIARRLMHPADLRAITTRTTDPRD
jgi:ClpX C4-type zinc finger